VYKPVFILYKYSLHPRTKFDVGYRLSRSGLAVAYGYKNITYLGPIIADISVASDSRKINVTYSNQASPSIELRNPNGFEVYFNFLFFKLFHISILSRYAVLVNKFVVQMIWHG
jgi:hypothetical protein